MFSAFKEGIRMFHESFHGAKKFEIDKEKKTVPLFRRPLRAHVM
jgi:hypothetical protein